jgi:hypothetical protein
MASVPFTYGIRLLIAQAIDYWVDHGGLSFWDAYREEPTFIGQKVVFTFDKPTEAFLSTRDIMETSFALFKIDGTDPSPSWDGTDFSNAETIFETWWGAVKGYFPALLKFEAIKWYQEGAAIVPPNPVHRTTVVNVAGTGSNAALPPQCSSTVTLQVPLRKNWGRFYLPQLDISVLQTAGTTEGRYKNAFVDDMATAAHDMFDDLGGIGLIPAVYSRAGHSFMAVGAVEVDDVPDIQRRRRPATTGYRNTQTL